MTAPIRNHDIAELKRLDLAHHLPAQADHKVIAALGGSRIITRADGVYIHDGEGHQILDGMAGLWCVNVGYGRDGAGQGGLRPDAGAARTTTPSSRPRRRRR